MDDHIVINHFQQALVRIGFTNLASREIMDQGLDDAWTLLQLTEGDIKSMCKIVRDGGVVIPFMAQQRLQTFRFWAFKRARLGQPIDPNMFTVTLEITDALVPTCSVEIASILRLSALFL